jgi:hypothetical protein
MTNTDTLLEWARAFCEIQIEHLETDDFQPWDFRVRVNGEKEWFHQWNPLENISHMAMVLEKLEAMPKVGLIGLKPKDSFDLRLWEQMPKEVQEQLDEGDIPFGWMFKNTDLILQTIKEVVENE